MKKEKTQQQRLIRNIDLFSVLLRSFFIQTVWNFKSLLAVGLCFALIPIGKRVCKNKQEMKAFLNRHLSFFNAHPYFSAYALGAIARLEEAYAMQELDEVEKINRFKNAIIGPLGAVGDQFFWATVKPTSLIIGITGIAVFEDVRLKLASIAIMLIVYNVPHLYIRAKGLWQGYQEGFEIYKTLRMEHFRRLKSFYALIGSIALGVFIGYTISMELNESVLSGITFLTTGIATMLIRTKSSSFYLPIGVAILLALIIGLL